jgi:hypothetical protein
MQTSFEPADYTRQILEKLRDDETWRHQRARLLIHGYSVADDEDAVRTLIRNLRRAVFPGRSGGIAAGPEPWLTQPGWQVAVGTRTPRIFRARQALAHIFRR